MFTRRQQKILELLLNNVQGMSGAKLSEHLEVSSRTIRNEIGEINRIWKDGSLIKASKKTGYYIEEQYRDSVREYLLTEGKERLEEEIAHRGWMILGMTLEKGQIDIFDIGEELSLSQPAVYKEIVKFQKKMDSEYQCKILRMSAEKVWVESDEKTIRQTLFKIIKNEMQKGIKLYKQLLQALLYKDLHRMSGYICCQNIP